jgi:hypothetical protein
LFTTIRIQTTETQPFILLPAYVNGKGPFDFVLDTGAAMSILTKELAAAIVADIFSALSQAVGTKFDGILGFNFLSKFKIEIDYPNERLGLLIFEQ